MGFDLADAYQQLPNAPAQRRRFVFEVEGDFFVWVVGMFGIATMAALFGQLCDVLCWWIEHSFPAIRARHFADDHLILHDGPDPCPPTTEIYSEVARFGWTVHATKHFSWSRRFVLLGFEWDMDKQTVALTEEKRSKYLRKLSTMLAMAAVRYKDISSMAGTLVHVCSIFPERRSSLNAIYAFRNRFDRRRRFHSLDIPTSAASELRNWLIFLKTPPLARSFRPPSVSFPHLVYSDASNLGCGVVIDGKAQAWALPGIIDQGEMDIGVMEAWALQLALEACVSLGAKDCTVRFQVDNLGVVYAFRKGRSRSKWTNHCLRCIAEIAIEANITMSMAYIASTDNLADAPSRGDCSRFQPLNLQLAAPWQEFLGAAPPPIMRASRFLRHVRSDVGTVSNASDTSGPHPEPTATSSSPSFATLSQQFLRNHPQQPPPHASSTTPLSSSTRPEGLISAGHAPIAPERPRRGPRLHPYRSDASASTSATNTTLPTPTPPTPFLGTPSSPHRRPYSPSTHTARLSTTSRDPPIHTPTNAGAPVPMGLLLPALGLTPAAVWVSLSDQNKPTCDLSLAGARAISPRSQAALLLTPAAHLIQAMHGSSDLAVAQTQSRVLLQSVKENTRVSYGRGIIAYLAWCEDLGLPEHFRFPAAINILLLYLQKDMSKLRPGTIDKRAHALQYWHRVQRMPWALEKGVTRTLQKTAKIEGLPPLEKRRPVRLNDLKAMVSHHQPDDNAHVAILAAALLAFFAMCRPGEVTVRSASEPHSDRARWAHIV